MTIFGIICIVCSHSSKKCFHDLHCVPSTLKGTQGAPCPKDDKCSHASSSSTRRWDSILVPADSGPGTGLSGLNMEILLASDMVGKLSRLTLLLKAKKNPG